MLQYVGWVTLELVYTMLICFTTVVRRTWVNVRLLFSSFHVSCCPLDRIHDINSFHPRIHQQLYIFSFLFHTVKLFIFTWPYLWKSFRARKCHRPNIVRVCLVDSRRVHWVVGLRPVRPAETRTTYRMRGRNTATVNWATATPTGWPQTGHRTRGQSYRPAHRWWTQCANSRCTDSCRKPPYPVAAVPM